MCGRYSLGEPDEDLFETLFSITAEIPPRFNVAPTDPVPVVRARDGAPERSTPIQGAAPSGRSRFAPARLSGSCLELAWMRWGLIPFWSKALPKVPWINARVETAATKSPYKQCFERRRCLLPADGFYEWEKRGAQRIPFHVRFGDRRTFFMAGLWGWWRAPDGEVIDSCTILTRAASGPIAALHDRQPVILSRERLGDWLDPALSDLPVLEALLDDPLAEAMELVELVGRVNSVRNEGPELWEEA